VELRIVLCAKLCVPENTAVYSSSELCSDMDLV
jgi:hypothetical protein